MIGDSGQHVSLVRFGSDAVDLSRSRLAAPDEKIEPAGNTIIIGLIAGDLLAWKNE
jgi:hypothetical protein